MEWSYVSGNIHNCCSQAELDRFIQVRTDDLIKLSLQRLRGRLRSNISKIIPPPTH